MRSRKTLILSATDVAGLVDIGSAMRAVEGAFREYGRGRVQMPAKIYLHLDRYGGDFRAMPAYIERTGACTLKWVNVHPMNRRFGLPTVMAVIIVSDPKTALPLCIMDGTRVTDLRTGAAGGVAAKYLARRDSRLVGLVGCGAQARTQLAALRRVFRLEAVKVWSPERPCAARFVGEVRRTGLAAAAARDARECVRDCDIIVTTTPSRKPIVKAAWLKRGAHINAIGADAPGKQELESAILKRAKIVVDAWEQASHSGEINVPVKKGVITKNDIYADIGQVVVGRKKGRSSDTETTVFDSTGLAIQDVAVAELVYRTALRQGIGKRVRIV